MRIDEILDDDRPCFSFEFFPPKTEKGAESLWRAASELRQEEPAFVSVTYGAGGSTRDRTIGIVKRIKQELGLEAMAHFTCVGATVDELRGTLDEMRDAGIENVLLDVMKKKVAAGARFLITQLFFDNELYFDFVEKARAAGVEVPIIPGIMPVTNFAQIKRFTEMCGASIPPGYEAELAARKDDPETVRELGVAYATMQCADLLQRGAPGIHFYVLNKAPSARAILAALRAGGYGSRALAPA